MLTDRELERRIDLEWCKQLCVGDAVVIGGKLFRIAGIENTYSMKVPAFVLDVIYFEWIPMNVAKKLHDFADWVCEKLGHMELYDRTLTLENGNKHSAFDCDSPGQGEN